MSMPDTPEEIISSMSDDEIKLDELIDYILEVYDV